MSALTGDFSPQRPIILGVVSAPRNIRRPSGGGGRVNFGNMEQRVRRLDLQFDALQGAIGDQVQLAESIQAADPQLVLVMEARDENIDLAAVADNLGFEIISEAESRVDPDDEFQLVACRLNNVTVVRHHWVWPTTPRPPCC